VVFEVQQDNHCSSTARTTFRNGNVGMDDTTTTIIIICSHMYDPIAIVIVVQ
jgi:hypothetical protein